jgi:hypothetical protein
MSSTDAKAAQRPNIEPKAVMSAAELEEWDRLSPAEQLETLRAAIDRALTGGTTSATMDEIFEEALRRHPNARV